MTMTAYERPEIVYTRAIVFETTVSGGSSFPGLGGGVDGVPAEERGDFPGGGATGGVFPGRGPTHGHRP